MVFIIINGFFNQYYYFIDKNKEFDKISLEEVLG